MKQWSTEKQQIVTCDMVKIVHIYYAHLTTIWKKELNHFQHIFVKCNKFRKWFAVELMKEAESTNQNQPGIFQKYVRIFIAINISFWSYLYADVKGEKLIKFTSNSFKRVYQKILTSNLNTLALD